MDDSLLRFNDMSFPVCILEHVKPMPGLLFEPHLHENHIQLFYFTEGRARIHCDQTAYEVGASDILMVNKGELHYGEGLSGEVSYLVFRVNLKMLSSCGVQRLEEVYISPLLDGLFRFRNVIDGEVVPEILDMIVRLCLDRRDGYELRILGGLFDLLGELFLNHGGEACVLQDAERLMKRRKALANVFDHIERNVSERLSLSTLADLAHMSEGHLCRTFRKSTGRTPVEYINRVRIERAVALLNRGGCNVTEAAMSVGFDDVSYFSRVFKRYMGRSPRSYIKDDRRYFL